MPSRDPILETFSSKFQNQVLWGEDEVNDTLEEGKVGKTIRKAFDK